MTSPGPDDRVDFESMAMPIEMMLSYALAEHRKRFDRYPIRFVMHPEVHMRFAGRIESMLRFEVRGQIDGTMRYNGVPIEQRRDVDGIVMVNALWVSEYV